MSLEKAVFAHPLRGGCIECLDDLWDNMQNEAKRPLSVPGEGVASVQISRSIMRQSMTAAVPRRTVSLAL